MQIRENLTLIMDKDLRLYFSNEMYIIITEETIQHNPALESIVKEFQSCLGLQINAELQFILKQKIRPTI